MEQRLEIAVDESMITRARTRVAIVRPMNSAPLCDS
jgi:hypothetical protein